jgi:hypothetical protein
MAIDRVAITQARKLDHMRLDARDEKETIELLKNMVHKYKNLEKILHKYDNRKPLSIIQLIDGRFGCMICPSNLFVEFYCGSHKVYFGGSWYYNWTSARESVWCGKLGTSNVRNYCLLLPKLTPKGMPSRTEEPMCEHTCSERSRGNSTRI